MFKLRTFNTYCPKMKMHKTTNLHCKMHPKHKKELELNFAFSKPTKSFENLQVFFIIDSLHFKVLSIVHLERFLEPILRVLKNLQVFFIIDSLHV